VCVFVICAEDDEAAERLAASIDLRRLHMALNLDTPVPTLAEAQAHAYTEEERRYVRAQRERAVIGGPAHCRDALLALAERYAADEVMALTITGDEASRLRSYELLAGAFALA
jgi:alkanesulfonate monooxygenase SsuD/methylene tetrahydromethanopterin reductase-like flavin-dependent oxidoreductase (luciferase family)